ncbi:MAG: PSD1 and planctomycete cytochrome C domain-containing protein [Acidobacteriota bacterium]
MRASVWRGSLAVVCVLFLASTAIRAWQAAAPQEPASTPQPAATPAPQSASTAQQAPGAMPAADAAAVELFETRVRPLLAANCYACHAKSAMAGLRVDSREALLKGGETGPALVPGDPERSALLKVLEHADGFPKMPRGRAKLAADDIAAVAAWIKAGAVWPGSADADAATPVAAEKAITPEQRAFWAFQPLASHTPPAVTNTAWPKTDIDRFILARLEKEGLAPVAAADKLTLLRRATLDLTGLPPTPAEVDAFLADDSADAFEKVVDRLLASPAYGEMWGRWWLDVARYGEDDYRSLDPEGRGYNPYPNAYLYRDWVIRAFNDDLPYDRFITAQLAADKLPEPDRLRHLPALGFLGLGPWFYDNGAVEITRADERHDRVDAVSRGMLGLTVACARCHDHKYDPIPTKDYYALAGVFLNTEYHEYPLAPKAIVEARKAQDEALERKRELLGEYTNAEAQQLAGTLAFQAAKYMKAAWQVAGEPKRPKTDVVEREKLDYELFDRWLAFLEKKPTYYPYLKDWQAMIARGGTAAEAEALATAFQDLIVGVLLEEREVRKENDIIRARALPTAKPRKLANKPNEFKTNDDFCPGCDLELRSMTKERTALYRDVFVVDLETDSFIPGQRGKPGLLRFRGWGLEQRLGADRRALIEGLRKDIEAMEKALPPMYAYVHGVRDVEAPEDLKVHLRGSPTRLGDTVARGFLTVLSPGARTTFTEGSGRLELAKTIAASPLAMRVIVNRIWKGHFGTGLVNTPSNFGLNGERPSHPELLDYLAQTFVANGQSMKALHREIMRSAVYRLSADHDATAMTKDADNRLYWRHTRRRLSAEQIRDAVLFVSGALDTKVGGPSVPLTPLATRRTVYGKVSRYQLDEFLQLFDFPSPSQTAEQRYATNVPLQRLFFMNSDFMQQHAEKLAESVADAPDDEARIARVYRRLFGRAPTAQEVQAGREFLQAEAFRQYEDRKAAEKAAAGNDKEAGSGKKADPRNDQAATADEETAGAGAPEADGMMAGAKPGATAPAAEAEQMLPVTVFGRYVKILLSSNEFIFVS